MPDPPQLLRIVVIGRLDPELEVEEPRLDDIPAHAGPVADPAWRAAWGRLAPARQDDISRVYANLGKAIAAL